MQVEEIQSSIVGAPATYKDYSSTMILFVDSLWVENAFLTLNSSEILYMI